MYLKRIRGFTLIELITVISIIIILVGLLSPVVKKTREQAKEQKARAMAGSLEVAINMFYTDQEKYPANLGELVNSPNPNYGPYMDIKDFEGGQFLDPWGEEYHYAQPGSHNLYTFDVWSSGSDKEIGNW